MRFRKTNYILTITTVLLAAMFISAPASAQMIEARWYDSVPREPMWFIQAGSHTRTDENPYGLAPWWRNDNLDAVDNLLMKIKEGYGYGARRFFINRPMGGNGLTHVTGASWMTMPEWKRCELVEKLNQFLQDPNVDPVHLFWFVGSDLSDPYEINGWHGDTPENFLIGETDTWAHTLASRNTIGGWISTGSSGLVIDHSSPVDERQHYMYLSRQLNGTPFDFTIMGEAFPLETDKGGNTVRNANGAPELDPEAAGYMGWVGTESYIRHPSRWPVGTVTDTWPPDPETTRLFMWFEKSGHRYGTESDRRGLIEQTIREGLIPITLDQVMFEHAMTIYNLMNDPHVEAKSERRIFLAMPGKEEFVRQYVDQIEAAGFPMESVEYMLQITARVHSVFPDEDIAASLPDGVSIREYTAQSARQSRNYYWAPKPYTAWYYDYEPRHKDENGNVIGSWLWPRVDGDGFSKADVHFLREAYAGCADALPDMPGSIYGVPRVLGIGAPNPLHVQNMMAFRKNTESYGFAQLNLYPPYGAAKNREITKDNVNNHIDRILLGEQAMNDLTADGTPIWAMMMPLNFTDNALWFGLYTQIFQYTDIDTLIIWVNPRSESAARDFANETIEAIPHLVRWLERD